MKKFILTVGVALVAFASVFAASPEDDRGYVTETFKVEQFDGIVLGGAFDVQYEVTEGDPYVEVTAPKKLMDNLDVRVKKGDLKIDLEKGFIRLNLNGNVKVKACSRTLKKVELSGAGEFSCTTGIETDSLVARVNGAGGLNIKGLVASKASLSIAGAGGIEAEEIDVEDLEVRISGAGDATIKGEAAKANITVSGTGGADITELKVSESLETKMAGIGKIKK